jgi:predicted esterase
MITRRDLYRAGHLTARPGNSIEGDVPFTGLHHLDLGGKDGLIYVPETYRPSIPANLAVMLHGAGGDAAHGMSLIRNYADANNMILLAPVAQEYSWDIIAGNSFGPDVLVLDHTLEFVFENFAINSSKVAIGGFSDGASYALCLGLSNGDLFTNILAFSPGFYHTAEARGKPEVFISHGTKDSVLPINPCSRRIVPALERSGIPVLYKEFNGEHIIPPDIAQAGVAWFVGK